MVLQTCKDGRKNATTRINHTPHLNLTSTSSESNAAPCLAQTYLILRGNSLVRSQREEKGRCPCPQPHMSAAKSPYPAPVPLQVGRLRSWSCRSTWLSGFATSDLSARIVSSDRVRLYPAIRADLSPRPTS